MSDTITISCPKCEKSLTLRAELEGKKVRCKDCRHTFVVKAPPKKAAEPKKAAVPTPKAGKKVEEDEYENPNPYGITEMDFTLRCPLCAAEMESEEAVLCINCGFNVKTREQIKTVKTIETTDSQKFLWLLPGILCVIVVLILSLCFLRVVFVAIFVDMDYENSLQRTCGNCCLLWMAIFSLFGIFYAGRFAIRRLILHPSPPEKEKG